MMRIFVLMSMIVFAAILAGCPESGTENGGDTGAQSGTPPAATADNQTILGAEGEKASCPHCGMDALASNARIKTADGMFDSLACWVAYAEENGKTLTDAEVLDLSSGAEEKMMKVTDANFVKVKLMRGSMPPFFAAFSDKAKAAETANLEASEVLDFNGAVELVKSEKPMHGEAAESGDGHEHEHGETAKSPEKGFAAPAASKNRQVTNEKCPMCSMSTLKTPTLVKYGPEGKETYFASMECWLEYAEENKLPPESAQIVDYDTLGKEERFEPVSAMFYVQLDSLRYSMPPYFAAFSDLAKAEAFAKEHNSKAVGFGDVQIEVFKYEQEEKNAGRGGHHH
ncbi:MAG: nitrous oxide reductase accessory protein NosL [bacterium]|jgi:YHS domain-containing protein